MKPVLLLLLPVLGVALLVWLGALIEWIYPSDNAPLEIDQDFSRNDAHFADRFKGLAVGWWQEGSPFVMHPPVMEPGTRIRDACLVPHLATGTNCHFDSEVWIRQSGLLGDGTRARAILCEGSLVVGRNCHIERWIHAEDTLTVDEGSHLGVRATSARVISLGPGCRSNLISASEIHWSTQPQVFPMPLNPWIQHWDNFERHIVRETSDGTVFVDGDVMVEESAHIDFPLVVRGSLYVRQGALLAGDIKTHGDLVVEHSEILGNLTALGRLILGDGAVVQGCLRGDLGVWLGDKILVGRPHRLVAVVGSKVLLSGCGTLHGRLKALGGWVEVAG